MKLDKAKREELRALEAETTAETVARPPWINYPADMPPRFNGGIRCDAWIGPCACGATHDGVNETAPPFLRKEEEARIEWKRAENAEAEAKGDDND